MITLEEFKQCEGSESTQRTINEFGITIYFRQNNGDDKFNIAGYVTGFERPAHFARVDSIDDCNRVFKEVCDQLTFLSKFQEDIDMHNFFEEMHKRYTPNDRQRRFKSTSDDGIISVSVKKEEDLWIPKVRDYEKGTKEYRVGFISSAVPTEKEAETICKNCLNEYNTYGNYTRDISKPKYIFEHQIVEIADTMDDEYYLYERGITTGITQEQMNKIKIMIENGLI